MKIKLNISELKVLTKFVMDLISYLQDQQSEAGTMFEKMQFDAQIELLTNMMTNFQKKLIDNKPHYTIKMLLMEAWLLKMYQDTVEPDLYSRNTMLSITSNVDQQYINKN